MTIDPFAQAIEALGQRMARVRSQIEAPDNGLDPLHELQTAVEELMVAKEEMRAQNEELIAARLEAEEQRHRYRDLFENAPDAHVVSDAVGVIQEANRAAAGMLHAPAKRLVGKPLVLFVAAEDRLAFQARLARAAGGPAGDSWKSHLRPHGQPPVTADVSVAAVHDAKGAPVGLRWLIRDVTAREQAERLAVIGQMMTGLAHESRNALQRAQACLERLNWQLQDRPESRDLLGRVQQAQNDLVRLFEDVREYAAPLRLDVRPCDLRQVWRDAWARLTFLHEGRDARLEEDAETDPQCTGDAGRLGQVFRNIFENALAACKDPVRVVVRCGDAALGGAPALRVAVRDNGPGLSDEQRRRIFDPFFTTKSQGTGLGMAIARQIVETHGGRIAVGENPPPGAEILITLPRSKP